jgi:hypothetical protein
MDKSAAKIQQPKQILNGKMNKFAMGFSPGAQADFAFLLPGNTV